MPPLHPDERVAVLENDVRHVREDISEIKRTLRELNELLQQAKGAKWIVLTGVAIATAAANAVGWAYGMFRTHP